MDASPQACPGGFATGTGHVEEALQHYEDDLGLNDKLPRCAQHRGNIWALHGFHESLKRLGRIDEAEQIRPVLEAATANSDIEVTSSCCCRKTTQ